MPMRRIKVSVGRTINVGNFESERVDFGIEMDVSSSDGEYYAIEKIYETLREMVDNKCELLKREKRQ